MAQLKYKNASHPFDVWGRIGPVDIVYCAYSACPLRSNCKRSIELPVPEHVQHITLSEFRPDGNGKCQYQIEPEKDEGDLLSRVLELRETE